MLNQGYQLLPDKFEYSYYMLAGYGEKLHVGHLWELEG